MATDLDLTRIEEASRTADPAFRDSPQSISEPLCAVLGRQVVVKPGLAEAPRDGRPRA